MRLYIDEDLASRELVRTLRNAGHDVATPHDESLLGESDTLQFTRAVQNDRATVTRNSSDFRQLHDLVIATGGSHPGILTIHSDNDRRRDMKPGRIATAVQNIQAVVSSMQNLILCLNEWR